MFTVSVKQDPLELALLKRIAVALEDVAPILEAEVAATERIAVALEQFTQPQKASVRTITYQFNGQTIQSTGDSLMFNAKSTEVPGKVVATLKVTDAEGNAADFDSPPTWAADNADVIDSIVPAADGLSAELHLTNTVGASQLTVGTVENGVAKDYVDTISIIAGDATSVEFVFGTVTPDA